MNEWKPVLCCNESAPGQRRDKTGQRIVLPGLAVANSSELRDSGLVNRISYPRGVISRHGRREIMANICLLRIARNRQLITWRSHIFLQV